MKRWRYIWVIFIISNNQTQVFIFIVIFTFWPKDASAEIFWIFKSFRLMCPLTIKMKIRIRMLKIIKIYQASSKKFWILLGWLVFYRISTLIVDLMPNVIYIYIYTWLISDVPLWTPSHGCAKAERPDRTYIQQLCADTWCSPEELPKAMDDREVWRKRVRDIRADGTTWWWWYIYSLYIYIYIYKLYIYIYIQANQSKHTPGKRDNDPHINQPNQPKVIYAGNKNEFKYPINKALHHICYLTKATSWKYTYIYITRM